MTAVTISDLEDKIYDFFDGVLPTIVDITEKNLGYTIRFTGYATQKDPIHVDGVRRNQCWINLQRAKAIYRYPTNDDGSVYQEMEFTYSVTLETKQTDLLLNTAMVYAAKLVAHRDGYELFDIAGISDFSIVSQNIKPINNNSVFFVELVLRLRAVIVLSDIKRRDSADSVTVSIYDDDKKVYDLSID